jgi:hypothetical protein
VIRHPENAIMSESTDVSTLSYRWAWSTEEHLRLHRALMREVAGRGTLRLVRAGILLFVAGTLVLGGYRWLQGDSHTLTGMIPWLLLVGVWWAIFSRLIPRSSAKAFQKLHHGDQWLRLSPEGVETGCDVCSTRLRWEAFKRAVETPDFFLLFYSGQCAVFLPNRVLGSREESDRLRSFLQAHVPGEVRLGERR